MAHIDSATIHTADTEAAQRFYAKAFGLGDRLRLRTSQEHTTGLRGFTMALTVSQPSTADSHVASADRDGDGSHRIAINGDAGAFTDPDGS